MEAEARFNEIADDLAAQNDDVELRKAEWPSLAQDALSL